ncbi:MAG: hypothetical protein IJS52_03510 [Bacilli bacterium]|nr:hypothetical protein [Bacilli bacterium]
MVLGVWENPDITVVDSLLIALIAIIIVFLTLIIVIVATALFQKGTDYVTSKINIKPRKENEILSSDQDAVVAVLVASIEFHKETGKGSRVLSITQIQE